MDCFLYEIHILIGLHGCGYMVKLDAIVLDDTKQRVKGILQRDASTRARKLICLAAATD
jgi:hypothetical protein